MEIIELKSISLKKDNLNIDSTNVKIKFRFYNFFIRGIDIFASMVGLISLLPIMLFVIALNKINREDANIFFIQERIGKNGKLFKLYKFQTMINGADEKLYKYLEGNPEAKEEYRINKKLKFDPRITKTGKILRRTSLDEFPQFINILKGEMSLVGPRPYLPREIPDMGDAYKIIIRHKPGLTGPWQISGRNNLTFEDRIALDCKYIEKGDSLAYDLGTVLKTLSCTIKGVGAL